MKRTILILLALLAFISVLPAQEAPPYLSPKDAKTMALGGAFTSLSTGYESLFGNPAAFAAAKGSLTLGNVNTWFYVRPTQKNLDSFMQVIENPEGAIGLANELVTENGIGAGASMGLGYVGRGLGVGAYVVTDEYLQGNTLLGSSFTSSTQGNLVVGIGIPLGPFALGGDIRPFFRIDGDIPANELVGAMYGSMGDPMAILNAQPAVTGLGLFMDLGATFSFGSFTAALTVRDLAPPVTFKDTSFGDVLTALQGGSLPTGTGDTKTFFLPNITAGLSWAPRLIPYVLEPSLYLEVQDPVRAIKDKAAFWNLLHLGGELKVLSFMYLRGGINQGWLSAGAGLNLFILSLDAAVFTEELGPRPGSQPRSGVALQVALHL